MSTWIKISYYRFTSVSDNIKLFFRKLKWWKQRITRGYADCDIWDLDNFLAKLIASTTKELAETKHGYPGQVESIKSEEDWDKILRQISFCFRDYYCEYRNKYDYVANYTLENKDSISEDKKNKMWQAYIFEEQKIEEFKKERLKLGFELLSKYFSYLWD